MNINPRYEQIQNYTIIKRDGREEQFYLDKLIKVIKWSTESLKTPGIYIEKLLDELSLKINDKMKIQDLYDEMINIAVSKISAIAPDWDDIAKYLYLLKIYKEEFNLKRIGTYPPLSKFISNGLKSDMYDKKIIDTFTEDEIDELSNYIDPNRDLLFNYKGLRLFFDKYCKGMSKKKLELPQVTYMAGAMHSHFNEPHETSQERKARLKNIMKTYNLLSNHQITFSTPRISFGLSPRAQLASCVLITPDDDTLSLNATDGWAAVYSKFSGGIAFDYSYIRARGSVIKSNRGLSDGPIPFIKRYEQTISSFNQGGCLAKGSLVNVIDRNTSQSIQIPIEEVIKDQMIESYNPKTQTVSFQKVLDYFEFEIPQERQYELEFDNGCKIITSDHHPIFYKNSNGEIFYKRTDQMEIGDVCITNKNQNTKLISIKHPDKPVQFYDLEVENNNNYFACAPDSTNTDDKILVHNTRSGAGIVYFPWWHMDVMELIMLKDAGGAEENRARKLKYGMKINRVLLDRIDKDEYITLFDPKETSILNKINGYDFEKKYKELENNGTIRSKKIKARELIETFFKVRVETGNLYVAFMDNINEQEMTGRYISMSNLCSEITVPSRAPRIVSEKYYKNEDGKYEVHMIKESGEIGLCNLTSIDSMQFYNSDEKQQWKLIKTLLLGMDNSIDSQFYPVPEGAWTNKAYRPIGIGVTNLANLLAFEKRRYSDQETYQFINDLFDSIYYKIYYSSMELAKERGFYEGFKKSNWAKGLTPYHLSRFKRENPLGLDFKNEEKWDKLAELIKRYGVRFSLHAAIAPSATNAKVVNATESCEPIMDLFYVEAGTHNLPTVVKGRGDIRQYYEKCWDIEPRRILELAAIRQIYLDQSQSFTQYYKKPDSITDLYRDLRYAESLGIKTLYYIKTPKFEAEMECSSCSV